MVLAVDGKSLTLCLKLYEHILEAL